MSDILSIFRKIAFLEGCSFLALGITMPLKYKFDMPTPNYWVGMIHGALFIAYVILLLWVWKKYRWKFSLVFWSGLASLIPFGTFIADKLIFHPAAKK
ncbi:MAG: DUF3817 domain-containing protein [Spirosomataceae bacterium]